MTLAAVSPLASVLSAGGVPAAGAAPNPPPGGGVSPFSVPTAPAAPAAPAASQAVAATGEPYTAGTWGQTLHQLVREVNARQTTAGALVRDVLAGGKTAPHEAVLAMEEASVSFQLLAEMRNKVVESYQEVMRMQV